MDNSYHVHMLGPVALAVHLHTTSLGPLLASTAMCVPVARSCNHRSTHWELRPSQLLMCLQLAPAVAACHGPHHYVCVYNQCPLCRNLQLAPTAWHMHMTASGHHCCLPWSLTAGPGCAAEDLNRAVHGPHSCQCGGLKWTLAKETSCPIWLRATICPNIWFPEISELEGRSIEIIQRSKKEWTGTENVYRTCGTLLRETTYASLASQKEKKGRKGQKAYLKK